MPRAADGPHLELIVKTRETWDRAEADIAAHGSTTLCKSGYEQQRPSVAIALKNKQLYRQLLNDIGATPTSRTSVDTVPVKSALQEFLTRTKETNGQLQQSS